MMKRATVIKALLAGSVLCTALAAWAVEVTIYPVPRFRMQGDLLELRDVARIEVKDADRESVGSMVIDARLYDDGYIDRRELLDLVKSGFGGTVSIHGGGVAVTRDAAAGQRAAAGTVQVRKGDRIRYAVVRGRVKIEIGGVAMGDGMEGDEVQVKLNTSKVVTGRVSSPLRVESGL
jgi:hypothetical protein